MTDRELLELAAKAGGIQAQYSENMGDFSVGKPYSRDEARWNPLNDDGDRYRLLAKLKSHIDFETQMVIIGDVIIRWPEDEETADRAIVRAAAEIGKGMA